MQDQKEKLNDEKKKLSASREKIMRAKELNQNIEELQANYEYVRQRIERIKGKLGVKEARDIPEKQLVKVTKDAEKEEKLKKLEKIEKRAEKPFRTGPSELLQRARDALANQNLEQAKLLLAQAEAAVAKLKGEEKRTLRYEILDVKTSLKMAML